jgi:hypothetical protein
MADSFLKICRSATALPVQGVRMAGKRIRLRFVYAGTPESVNLQPGVFLNILFAAQACVFAANATGYPAGFVQFRHCTDYC